MSVRRALPAILLFLVVIVLLQWRSGTFTAEFGRASDEAGHYINGLLIRDYLAAGVPGSPLAYARDYYLHYPKVSIGHWPPLFYVFEAAWMLAFGPSRLSVLALLAAIGLALAASLYAVGRRAYGGPAAALVTVLFLCTYEVQTAFTHVFLDSFYSLLVFAAALAFARYLKTESGRDSLLFGIFATAAILTKGNGLLTAFIPPFAVLLARKPRLFTRPSFWYPAALVALACGPWYIFTYDQAASGWTYRGPLLGYAAQAALFNIRTVVFSTGWAAIPLALVGLVTGLRQTFFARKPDARRAALLALLAATLLFHTLVPAGLMARYLIPAILVWCLLVAEGARWLALRLPLARPALPQRTAILTALVLAAFLLLPRFLTPPRLHYGFDQLAERITAAPPSAGPAVLVSSRHFGEGMLITEVAMRDRHRPSWYVIRASKLLAASAWSGQGYHLRHEQPAEVMALIEKIGIPLLVLDREPGEDWPHHRLLARVIKEFPDRWRLLEHYRGQPNLPGIDLYAYSGNRIERFSPTRLKQAIGAIAPINRMGYFRPKQEDTPLKLNRIAPPHLLHRLMLVLHRLMLVFASPACKVTCTVE